MIKRVFICTLTAVNKLGNPATLLKLPVGYFNILI